ncbi:hypothetical protein [Alienimonas sp. DA493]|uniref:hypothetical protein n=1 Tax=Alienimonas sp. DA493 TaxID=3373605 RepID=UPI003753FC6F
MFAAPPRCRPWIGPACAAAWGLSAAVLLTTVCLGLAVGSWPVRATLAAGFALAAAVWGWRNAPRVWRGWIAAAPFAGWAIGAFGWEGATVAAIAAWLALLTTGTVRREPRLRPEGPLAKPHDLGREPAAQAPAVALAEVRTAPPERALRAGIEFEDSELDDPEFEEPECDEPEPDQWFSRTADAVEGELLVRCEGGVGSGHVLFWPALPGTPRVHCHPADGLGRVRATRALPQGVRFEVVRPDGETGPVRVCYEATV